MPVKTRYAAGAVLCLNDIQCVNKIYFVMHSDISSTYISKRNKFNTSYFINWYAKLAQNITWTPASYQINEHVFVYN